MSLLTCSAGLISSWHPVNGEKPTGSQSASLYMALYVIALGTGGIKPNGEQRALAPAASLV
jgi:dipeptide/tripeptide permease